jgi:hypothetical protein
MNLRVIRQTFTDKSTIGELYIEGKFECFTLEDKVREIPGVPVSTWKVAKETAIPYGIYSLILDYSDRFKKVMPHILDVPGFQGIRCHSGNTDADTEGCLLVGRTKAVDDIGESKLAFDALFAKLQAANEKEKITILYTKDVPVVPPPIKPPEPVVPPKPQPKPGPTINESLLPQPAKEPQDGFFLRLLLRIFGGK